MRLRSGSGLVRIAVHAALISVHLMLHENVAGAGHAEWKWGRTPRVTVHPHEAI